MERLTPHQSLLSGAGQGGKVPAYPYQNKKSPHKVMIFYLERLRGIEPLSIPWQGIVLPLNHSRASQFASGFRPDLSSGLSPFAIAPFPKNACSPPSAVALLVFGAPVLIWGAPNFWEPYSNQTNFLKNRSYLVPDPRVELGTPASSGQRSTDELVRRVAIRFGLSDFTKVNSSRPSRLLLFPKIRARSDYSSELRS